MVLYRKYRPQKFAEIIGQKHVVDTLLSQLMSGKISHGYLFCGPRGTGKTSCARIIAKAVNCQAYGKNAKHGQLIKFGEPCNKCRSCQAVSSGSHLDLVEIDAASNRNIDDIRDLREKIKLSPVSARFKVYIIDEVHMLTREAFNALLKTLEEPPGHAIFVLCTTEVSKVPATILSRVQRFNFNRATESELASTIEKTALSEDIKIEREAIEFLVRTSDGSFRDAISNLDQLSSSKKKIALADVVKFARFSGWDNLVRFVNHLQKRDVAGAVLLVEDIAKHGGDLANFSLETVLFLEKLLFIKIGLPKENIDLANDQRNYATKLAENFAFGDLQNLLKLFLIAEGEIKHYPLPQIPLTLAICKYCQDQMSDAGEQISNVTDKEEVSHAAKISRQGGKSLEKIRGEWEDFLNKIKPVNAHVVALLRNSKPTGFDGRNLTIEVFFRFHKEKLEEPKIMNLICDMLKKTTGMEVTPKFVLAQRETKPTRTVRESNVSEINEEELSKIAQEIFSE